MSDQRIKGQEVEILLVQDGNIQSTITDIHSFEVGAKLELLQEGYLGETTDRYDEVFKGMRGRIEYHVENGDFLNLMLAFINRAKRRTPGTIINVKATLNFPNGQSPRLIFSNIFSGEQPIGVPGRPNYVTYGMEFACSDVRKI